MVDVDLIPAEQEKRLHIERKESGEVIRANSEQPLIAWMFGEGLIDDGIYSCLEAFLDRQWRYNYAQSAKSVSLGEVMGEADGGDNLYTTIIKRMRADDLSMISIVTGLEATKEAQHGARAMMHVLDGVFFRLQKATDDAIEDYKTACANNKAVIIC
jgi:hypothetical protein